MALHIKLLRYTKNKQSVKQVSGDISSRRSLAARIKLIQQHLGILFGYDKNLIFHL